MRTQIFKISAVGLALAILPFVNGCVAQSSEIISESDDPPVSDASQNAPTPAAPEPSKGLAAKPEPAPADATQKTLPPSVVPGSPAAELVKLAQAGVDEAVLLSYVTNSTKTFNLSSDEIIYLNDLGVPSNVITTIIEHDKAMKQIWAGSTPAQTASVQTAPAPTLEATVDQTASAPTYVEAPQTTYSEPPVVVNNNYFYDTLSPYGSWIEIDGYGRCWQPTVVVGNRYWQPYGDRGRWVYSDCGWYWLSDYSWGATTFHYGRWFNHPRWGWCWWPDTTWGPSWVTWRYSSDYCGWAPLPPYATYRPGFGFYYRGSSVAVGFDFGLSVGCFTFVPTSHFCDPYPWRHRVTATHVTTVYNNTTVINQFGTANNNRPVNKGIDPDRIRSRTRADIRQVRLQDAPTTGGRGRGEHLDRDGHTLIVNRPNFENNSNNGSTKPANFGSSHNHNNGNGNSRPQPPNNPQTPAGSGRDREGNRGNSRPSLAGGDRPTTPTTPTTQPPTTTTPPPSVSNRPGTPSVSKVTEPRPSAASRFADRPQDHQRGGDATLNSNFGTRPSGNGPDNSTSVSTQPNPSTTTKPSGSFVIIGDKNTKPTPVRPTTPAAPARPSNSQIAEVEPTPRLKEIAPPAPQFNTPQNNNNNNSSFSRPSVFGSSRNDSRPSYSAPANNQRPVTPAAPSVSQNPTVRFQNSTPAPAPAPSHRTPQSYSAPAPAPAQSYSAPRSFSSPAPAPSQPAPSQSYSAPRSSPSPSPSYSAPSSSGSSRSSSPSPAPSSRDSGNNGNGNGNGRGRDR